MPVKILKKVETIDKNIATLKAAESKLPQDKKIKISGKLKVLQKVRAALQLKLKVISMTIRSISLETGSRK